uniref:Secreted protein n=1 Tax=Magallana gigas TaxID=29159 RepID=A0A8W8IJ51_MAGGI
MGILFVILILGLYSDDVHTTPVHQTKISSKATTSLSTKMTIPVYARTEYLMYCFLFVMGDTSNSTVGSCVIDPSPKQPGRHSANQKGCSKGHITEQ